ncbi:hypothetical protein PUN28_015644 [Cardiocondyla obscurior]|uniref:Uncharacterized protein n=1 Tax=Cardiocondyla obscurior TaxID=286306 RepID=A0AAW2EWF1_9HYME
MIEEHRTVVEGARAEETLICNRAKHSRDLFISLIFLTKKNLTIEKVVSFSLSKYSFLTRYPYCKIKNIRWQNLHVLQIIRGREHARTKSERMCTGMQCAGRAMLSAASWTAAYQHRVANFVLMDSLSRGLE